MTTCETCGKYINKQTQISQRMITFGYNNKFSTALRALAAIGIGLVMVFSTEATVNVVKIIAAFLFAAGMVSLGYGFAHRKSGAMALMSVNAVVDIVIGLLLPERGRRRDCDCYRYRDTSLRYPPADCPRRNDVPRRHGRLLIDTFNIGSHRRYNIAVQSFLGKDYERACRHAAASAPERSACHFAGHSRLLYHSCERVLYPDLDGSPSFRLLRLVGRAAARHRGRGARRADDL